MNFPRLKSGRNILLATIVAVGVLIALVVGVKMSLVMTRYRAETLLSEVKALKLGESTASDAERLVARYGGSKQGSNDSPCSGNDCLFFAIPVHNWITQSLLRLSWFITDKTGVYYNLCDDLLTWRAMGVGIYSNAGRITWISIYLIARRKDGFSLEGNTEYTPVLSDVFEPLRAGYRPGVFHMTTPGGGAGVIARITPQASGKDRDRAFDLNLSCISSIRGCTELRELMPSVWEDHEEFLRLHTVEQAP